MIKTQQKVIIFIDELFATSRYDDSQPASYSHGWLDNYGKNDWQYWKVFIQEKNKTVWKAILNIATSENGKNFLYDIDPIKMVEGAIESAPTTTKVEDAVKSAVTTTNNSISDSSQNVNKNSEENQKNLSTESDNMKEERQSELSEEQAVEEALKKINSSDAGFKHLQELSKLYTEARKLQSKINKYEKAIRNEANKRKNRTISQEDKNNSLMFYAALLITEFQ